MSGTFKVEILVPERRVVLCDAVLLNVPETTGRIGVEARRAPLAASLAPGIVEIVSPNGKRSKFEIASGAFSFDANLARILTSDVKRLADE